MVPGLQSLNRPFLFTPFLDIPVLGRSFAWQSVAVNMHFKLLREHAREIIMITTGRITPNAWSALWSHSSQDPNQSKEDPVKEAPF